MGLFAYHPLGAAYNSGNLPLLSIFFNFVASCFLARILAWDSSAFQQIQSRGFADVADTIELLFCNNVGNIVPVDRSVIFHSNTPFFTFCRFEARPACIATMLCFGVVLSKVLSNGKISNSSGFRTLFHLEFSPIFPRLFKIYSIKQTFGIL